MKCPRCNAESPANSPYCGRCGADLGELRANQLNITCPKCGSQNNLNAKFCGLCGATLKPAVPVSRFPVVDPIPYAQEAPVQRRPIAPMPIAPPKRKSCVPACLITLLVLFVIGLILFGLVLLILSQDEEFLQELDRAFSSLALLPLEYPGQSADSWILRRHNWTGPGS